MGIMFDVSSYDEGVEDWQVEVIDNFFDNLKWEETSSNPKVEEVTYGQLMNMANMDTRWVYKGSVTTPPCATTVYWNVCRTVYPIKQKHVDMFMDQLAREDGLDGYGNFREIQETTSAHDVWIIDSAPGSDGKKYGDEDGPAVQWEIATIILAVLTGIMLIITGCFAMKAAGTIGGGAEK